MRSRLFLAVVFAVISNSSVIVYGQKKPEFETGNNQRFLKRSSFLNKEAPDVEVYDESGNSFRLAQARGKHTVVVFGCLT